MATDTVYIISQANPNKKRGEQRGCFFRIAHPKADISVLHESEHGPNGNPYLIYGETVAKVLGIFPINWDGYSITVAQITSGSIDREAVG